MKSKSFFIVLGTLGLAILLANAQNEVPQENTVVTATEEDRPKKPLKEMTTEEKFQLLQTLEDRLDEIKVKRLEIQKFKDELDIQRSAIEERIQYLENIKKELGDKLDKKMESDINAIMEITKVYEEMAPKKAAKIIESLDLDMARIVMKMMNKKKAAEILNKIADEKAIQISEYYAGFSRSQKDKTMDSVRRSKENLNESKPDNAQ